MDLFALVALMGLGLAMLALISGIASMAQGGEADQRSSHVLMLKRVGWQALAAAAVLLAV